MRQTLLLLTTLFTLAAGSSQKVPRVYARDFNEAVGQWQGSLTYLDYTSGQPYTMPAELEIRQLPGKNQFLLADHYPGEPQADGADTLAIADRGRGLNAARVVSRKKRADGSLELVTESEGVDGNDNRPATFRLTYVLGPAVFSRTKEVRFTGEAVWIKRHEYAYSRKVPPTADEK